MIVGRRRVARRWIPRWLIHLVIDWEPPFDWLFWRPYERRVNRMAHDWVGGMHRRKP